MIPAQTSNQKIAIVTGASSGIGLACANRLHRLGYKVYGASRNIQAVASDRVVCLQMNVDDDESVRSGIELVAKTEQRIDVVINCAGFAIAGAIEDTSIAEAKAQFETNFFGVIRVCHSVIPMMRQQQSGLIINISSLAGLTGIPFQGLYSASKFALEGLTESLRMELAAYGIQVVLIEPGDFATGFTAQRKMTQAAQTDTVYRHACDKAISKMAQEEMNGASPEIIAQLLDRIIQTSTPHLRYTAGIFAQTFGVGLKRFLPHQLYEKLLMQNYGLE